MRLSDDVITFILGIFTLFAYVSGKSSAIFYGLMLFMDAYFLGRDDQISLPFERSEAGRLQGLLIALGGWAGYILLTPVFVTGLIFITSEQLLLITQKLLPEIISTSPYFAILSAMLFGAIETRFFFGRVIEFLKDQLKASLDLSQKAIIIYLISIALFVIFHIFIKKSIDPITGLNVGLIATAAFAIFQVILVVWKKQTREAVGMHMITNGFAESIKQGLMTTVQIIQKFKII